AGRRPEPGIHLIAAECGFRARHVAAPRNDQRCRDGLRALSGSGNVRPEPRHPSPASRPHTMSKLTRRSFLAAAGAVAAGEACGAAQQKSKAPPGDSRSGLDVIIVGAGAAGIAAARRITASGRKCVLLEASSTVGGRCLTDTTLFGVPYDRGARALYTP